MHLLYIFIVAVGVALYVSGVFAHHHERQKTKSSIGILRGVLWALR
jgi:hypothetical protein